MCEPRAPAPARAAIDRIARCATARGSGLVRGKFGNHRKVEAFFMANTNRPGNGGGSAGNGGGGPGPGNPTGGLGGGTVGGGNSPNVPPGTGSGGGGGGGGFRGRRVTTCSF